MNTKFEGKPTKKHQNQMHQKFQMSSDYCRFLNRLLELQVWMNRVIRAATPHYNFHFIYNAQNALKSESWQLKETLFDVVLGMENIQTHTQSP